MSESFLMEPFTNTKDAQSATTPVCRPLRFEERWPTFWRTGRHSKAMASWLVVSQAEVLSRTLVGGLTPSISPCLDRSIRVLKIMIRKTLKNELHFEAFQFNIVYVQ